jgi:hypothetical protein
LLPIWKQPAGTQTCWIPLASNLIAPAADGAPGVAVGGTVGATVDTVALAGSVVAVRVAVGVADGGTAVRVLVAVGTGVALDVTVGGSVVVGVKVDAGTDVSVGGTWVAVGGMSVTDGAVVLVEGGIVSVGATVLATVVGVGGIDVEEAGTAVADGAAVDGTGEGDGNGEPEDEREGDETCATIACVADGDADSVIDVPPVSTLRVGEGVGVGSPLLRSRISARAAINRTDATPATAMPGVRERVRERLFRSSGRRTFPLAAGKWTVCRVPVAVGAAESATVLKAAASSPAIW